MDSTEEGITDSTQTVCSTLACERNCEFLLHQLHAGNHIANVFAFPSKSRITILHVTVYLTKRHLHT